MDTFDKFRIGKCIAWGGEHVVYNYGQDQVIKFSLFDLLFGERIALIKAEYDLRLCKEFFGDYILDTQIMQSHNGKRFAKIQQKIEGRSLLKEDLKDLKVAQQFRDLMRCHTLLLKSRGIEIDLAGGKGILFDKLTNIFITSSRRLVIIDALLISLPEPHVLRPFISAIQPIAISIQKPIIARYLAAISS